MGGGRQVAQQLPPTPQPTREGPPSLNNTFDVNDQHDLAKHQQDHSGLRRGDIHPQVGWLQESLNRLGCTLLVDCKFGEKTEQALKKFQKANGLQETGVLNAQTEKLLNAIDQQRSPEITTKNPVLVSPKDSGPLVQRLQSALINQGYDLGEQGADGIFGRRTLEAVQDYQRKSGRLADGYMRLDMAQELHINDLRDQKSLSLTGFKKGQSYEFKGVKIDGSHILEEHAAESFLKMKSAAHAAGIELLVNSAFRTQEQQIDLYNKYQNGTGNLAARPGYSNHQSGIALDLKVNGAHQANYDWLAKHAHDYGFIRTVPTEPWHWEYRPTEARQRETDGTLLR